MLTLHRDFTLCFFLNKLMSIEVLEVLLEDMNNF